MIMNFKKKSIYRGKVLALNLEDHPLPDGRRGTYEILRHPGGAAALPLLEGGRVLLIRQFRPALGRTILEIPAGKLEPGESPLNCIEREIREETGFAAGQLESLGEMITAPGFCDERIHLFLATKLTPCIQEPDDDEFIEVLYFTLREAGQMALEGKIEDGKTRLALLLLLARQTTPGKAP